MAAAPVYLQGPDPEALQPSADSAEDAVAAARYSRAEAAMEKSR
jgi:hypothetical protein